MNHAKRLSDRVLEWLTRVLALSALALCVFMLGFLIRESLPALRDVGFRRLFLTSGWRPVIFRDVPEFGLLNMLLATGYVSLVACLLALIVGSGCALCLSCGVSDKTRQRVMPFIDLLAAIPSVVYGFAGLYTVVKLLEFFGMATGESILAGGIVLAIMILPYMIGACCETMTALRKRYALASASLGVDHWYMAGTLILPCSLRGILISLALACGRAMGETMAVMMVLGNAPAWPRLLGKGETISALIALEMGIAEVGSTHFSALFAAGTALMVLLLVINLLFEALKRRITRTLGA